MTAKLARHRSTEPGPGPRADEARPGLAPQHRAGLRPALGTGLLAVAVVAALGVIVLGVMR